MAEDKAKRAARQKEYNARPENKKKRAANNRARRLMIKKHGKQALKGKDVDHKDGNPRNNNPSNLRIMSRKKNRGRNNNKGK
ncbi:HNH endonuclease [Vibrio fluvialis]